MPQEIHLLHVDDDETFATFVRDWLERTEDDLRVTTMTDPEAALEMIEPRDQGFDVVVSDYRMPKLSGLELFERVRERDSSVPFVLFTGQGSEEIARDALTTGVTDYVRKSDGPDSLSLLVRRVRSAVETRRLGAEAKRYGALVELLDIAVFVFGADGRLVSFNDAFADLVAADRTDLQGADVRSIPTGSDREFLDQYVRNLLDKNGPDMVSFQLNLRPGDGEVHPCRVDMTAVPGWDGRPESYVGVLRDLTDRERFSLTLTDLLGWAAGPYVALDEEWRITMLNEPAERLFGVEESGLVGRSLWEVYPAFEDSSFHGRLSAVAEAGEPDEFSTYYGPTAQHFRVRSYPTSTGVVVYFRDVTAEVERERELDLQRRRLAEFASFVSHDLRNPLSVARGHLAILRETLADGGDEREGLDAIERALDRAGVIIEDTLTFTEDVAIEDPAPTDLAEAVRRAWEFVSTEDATLEVVRGPTIRADRSALQRVLENLLRNAVEHGTRRAPAREARGDAVEHGSTSPRSQAREDAEERADRPARVSVGWLESDETTTGFYVEDDGPGIRSENRDSVFDPGVTTREDGTGLGLAIVRQIVLAHGWSIRATEGTTGGARFEITGIDPVPGDATGRETSYAEVEEDD